jgi:hypothetical protein
LGRVILGACKRSAPAASPLIMKNDSVLLGVKDELVFIITAAFSFVDYNKLPFLQRQEQMRRIRQL